MMEASPLAALCFREPREADAAAMWRTVRDSGVLDPNSPYCYLLLCRDFASTCAVAEVADEVVGFVTAYVPPNQPDTLFVWQIGVAETFRNNRIATLLLAQLLGREACRGITHIETTITPSNHASRALFEGLARPLGAALTEVPGFGAELFPEAGHEPEIRYRIGPLGGPDTR
ncbi:MAG: diaminobutyrate acetyltransferase [Leptospirillia bacterium]